MYEYVVKSCFCQLCRRNIDSHTSFPIQRLHQYLTHTSLYACIDQCIICFDDSSTVRRRVHRPRGLNKPITDDAPLTFRIPTPKDMKELTGDQMALHNLVGHSKAYRDQMDLE